MGVSIGAVAFRVNVSEFDLGKVAGKLFGEDFKPAVGYEDPRREGNAFLGKSEDLLFVESMSFTEQFFDPRPEAKAAVEKIWAYFGKPAFVLAFEEYDSGGTYGYTLMVEGVIRRQVRVVSGEKTIDLGEPQEAELRPQDQEEEEVEDWEIVQGSLQELMLKNLGFISFDMWDHLIEKQYFKKGG